MKTLAAKPSKTAPPVWGCDSQAGLHVKMEAANNCEAMLRWELSDGKYQDSLCGYATLAEVSEALDHKEIMAEL